jgi:hypothetical protein
MQDQSEIKAMRKDRLKHIDDLQKIRETPNLITHLHRHIAS